MKYGVLTFSYTNVKKFRQLVEEHGFFSVNLGDYMQTIAIRKFYRDLGIADDQVISVDRDTISSYSGDPVVLVMNGVFFSWSFPIPENVIPVFIGFHAAENVILSNADYFKLHQPIGCRDTATTALFKKYDIDAFTTGCLTMGFEPRSQAPDEGKPFIICGGGAGAFPADVMRHMPEDLLRSAEIVFQRKIVHRFPLAEEDMRDAELYTEHLLNDYRDRASMVVTSLHHAATPCISSGIPTIVCRKDQNSRFSFLATVMPIYTPERFADIDWKAPVPGIGSTRAALIDGGKSLLKAAAARA